MDPTQTGSRAPSLPLWKQSASSYRTRQPVEYSKLGVLLAMYFRSSNRYSEGLGCDWGFCYSSGTDYELFKTILFDKPLQSRNLHRRSQIPVSTTFLSLDHPSHPRTSIVSRTLSISSFSNQLNNQQSSELLKIEWLKWIQGEKFARGYMPQANVPSSWLRNVCLFQATMASIVK
ncbi:uncharacterized protein EURHEDRAFT_402347 [Aspergillus ruber CBS 135680]|uniref:Uncharacterized protein n=1 Tax=Aspergillus ruber (strain CBS 135680) TaxID=1388766 RepID=A0A017SF69_ASPRC|nr:uncharacterized protein EURHEDRAFT_402347 [Aspergillus ruber CBS 135680]EYE95653.1 hypothetical protein EURHEDRAFT_402347 [Aspergillus ruber CBS 135680]